MSEADEDEPVGGDETRRKAEASHDSQFVYSNEVIRRAKATATATR